MFQHSSPDQCQCWSPVLDACTHLYGLMCQPGHMVLVIMLLLPTRWCIKGAHHLCRGRKHAGAGHRGVREPADAMNNAGWQ